MKNRGKIESLEDKQIFIQRAFKKYEYEKAQGKTEIDFTEWFIEKFTKDEFKL